MIVSAAMRAVIGQCPRVRVPVFTHKGGASLPLWTPKTQKIGCPRKRGNFNQPLGARSRRRAALSRTIRIPRRHHQHAHRRARRPHRHHPLQEAQIIALAHLPHARPRIRSPFPPARSAQRLAQGPLFWPLASFQTSARRSGTPPPGTRTHNSSGDRRPEPRHRHRTAALSMLRPRPPRLHPQAHAQKCPRTMTHFSRFQARLSLLCASLRRHSPLRPADPIIFPSPFNKRSNHLRCPATTLIKSVATPHSALVSAKP